MTRRNSLRRSVTSLAALALGITATVLYGGPLNPPGGPIASTPGPEPRIAISLANTPGDADSLFKITQPGSYYLTGNITGVVGKHGIEIVASGVTLDLNGFDLVGVPGMGAFDGVSATAASLTNIAVVNGSVRNWGNSGINLGTVNVVACRVERIRAGGNVNVGVSAGSTAVVSSCVATGGTYGVYALTGSTVVECSATGAGVGIVVESACTVSNCSAFNTNGGISAGFGCTISNCSAYQNTGTGIATGFGCTISNCSAYQNTGTGIATGSGCTISNCSAYQNSTAGIGVASGSTVSNCSAYSNTGNGINAGSGCTVADCTARANTLDGIIVLSNCTVGGNVCASNGNGGDGAGIHATGADNRIEGNNCTSADRGIDVDAAGNIIIRNTCSGNTTDWDIVANNVFGPIIDRRAPASAAVVGFSAAGTLGSTDPNANFSY